MPEPIYVSDVDTLQAVASPSRIKAHVFIKFFLSRHQAKIFICKKHLDKHIQEIERQQHLPTAVKDNMAAKVYGIAQDYYDPQDDRDTRDETVKIVDRNYATVKYLIVINPSQYKGKFDSTRVSDEIIVSPEAFMYRIVAEKNHDGICAEFDGLWTSLKP